MMGGVIAMMSEVGIVLGIALVILAFVKGSEGEGKYDIRKVPSVSLFVGLVLILFGAVWLYQLSI